MKKAGDFLRLVFHPQCLSVFCTKKQLPVRVPRQLIKDYANDPNGPKMLALRAQRKHEMQVSFTVLGGRIRYDKDIFEKGKTQRMGDIAKVLCGKGE